ncbi:hypothetical protein C1646_796325 [Rhizophagus diaphanus]|nr:hypothetical protein C1646_796325 [Rhizophagus diaphanus] [Rhizophagus sp. MUCL 43196]
MNTRAISHLLKKVPRRGLWTTYWLERDFGDGGWIHSVTFSPSGEALAFAGHDSEISIAWGAIKNIRLTGLPYLSLLWTSEEKIIAAGYDCAPVLFERANKEWK